LQELRDKALTMLNNKNLLKWRFFYETLPLGMVYTMPTKIQQILFLI
jgi:hypothetical protein